MPRGQLTASVHMLLVKHIEYLLLPGTLAGCPSPVGRLPDGRYAYSSALQSARVLDLG